MQPRKIDKLSQQDRDAYMEALRGVVSTALRDTGLSVTLDSNVLTVSNGKRKSYKFYVRGNSWYVKDSSNKTDDQLDGLDVSEIIGLGNEIAKVQAPSTGTRSTRVAGKKTVQLKLPSDPVTAPQPKLIKDTAPPAPRTTGPAYTTKFRQQLDAQSKSALALSWLRKLEKSPNFDASKLSEIYDQELRVETPLGPMIISEGESGWPSIDLFNPQHGENGSVEFTTFDKAIAAFVREYNKVMTGGYSSIEQLSEAWYKNYTDPATRYAKKGHYAEQDGTDAYGDDNQPFAW